MGSVDRFRIAFVSGKLGDVDGVSLEVDKWAAVLHELGHEVFSIAGRYGSPLAGLPPSNQFTVPAIRFDSEEQRACERLVFPHLSARPPRLSGAEQHQTVERLLSGGAEVASGIHELVLENEIDVLIAENTNAMPMTLLGGVAVHRLASEMRVATVFHHHDFWWERSRFSDNRIRDLLDRMMPPSDPGLEHVVISSYAAHILSSLKRVWPQVIPNCEDFDNPVVVDGYNGTFRQELGYGPGDVLVVQPTRIVPRKRIEDSIRLLARLVERYPRYAGRLRYIVSLYQGDEPNEGYVERIRALAERAGIPMDLISDRVASVRGTDAQGRRVFTNRDVLVNANLVTYLPVWEGFGNALLEAVAARVPVVSTTYLVYKTDIMISGLRVVEVRDRYDASGALEIPDSTVDSIHHILTHPNESRAMAEENYRIARAEFGLEVLREKLSALLLSYGDEIRASRQRLARSGRHYSV